MTLTLFRYMDKKLMLQLNGKRQVVGILRGFDPFMNIVLDEAMEIVSASEKHKIGTVVCMSHEAFCPGRAS